jgi:hypothetical protein
MHLWKVSLLQDYIPEGSHHHYIVFFASLSSGAENCSPGISVFLLSLRTYCITNVQHIEIQIYNTTRFGKSFVWDLLLIHEVILKLKEDDHVLISESDAWIGTCISLFHTRGESIKLDSVFKLENTRWKNEMLYLWNMSNESGLFRRYHTMTEL